MSCMRSSHQQRSVCKQQRARRLLLGDPRRSQIWDRALDWLGSQGELSSDQLASTLLALALLKPMDGAEVSQLAPAG